MSIASRKFVRVTLVPYQGTDLMCAACGKFGAEWGFDACYHDVPIVGVHKRCVGLLHTKHERRAQAPATSQALAASQKEGN